MIYSISVAEENMLWRAKNYGDARLYQQAIEIKTPSCDKIQQIYSWLLFASFVLSVMRECVYFPRFRPFELMMHLFFTNGNRICETTFERMYCEFDLIFFDKNGGFLIQEILDVEYCKNDTDPGACMSLKQNLFCRLKSVFLIRLKKNLMFL